MPFFIALAMLVALSSAYLLHQFWSRELERIEPRTEPAPESEPDVRELTAA